MLEVQIFGRKFRVIFDGVVSGKFCEEMSIYNIANKGCDQSKASLYYDYEVIFTNNINFLSDVAYANPPTFSLLKDNSFVVDYGHSIIQYKLFNVPGKVTVVPRKLPFFWKILSMEYRNVLENLPQIFHELVVIPLMFFEKDKFPVHASAVYDKALKQVIMFGGTGGVGKTSIELLLAKNARYSFFADDFCVVDRDGFVFPNLAYPKIYGYNIEYNRDLRKRLLEKESFFSRCHWFVHYYLRGPNKVRRKINPTNLFIGGVQRCKQRLGRYFIICRASVKDLVLENVSVDRAVEATIEIVKNEYHSFLKHVRWLNVNLILAGEDYSKLGKFNLDFSWEILKEAFRNVDLYLLKIPIDMSLRYFSKKIFKILTS